MIVQVSLACRATGARPPAKIQWFRNNVAFNLPEGEDQLYPLQFLSHIEHRKGTPRMTIALAIGQPREGIESNSFGTILMMMRRRRRRTMEIMKMMATRLKTIVLNGPGIMSLSRWLKVNREQ